MTAEPDAPDSSEEHGPSDPPADETPTTAIDPAVLTPEPGQAVDPHALDDLDDGAAERGRLDIHHSVVRKIAERAADLTEGTTTVSRSLAGVGLGESGSSVRVQGYGDRVDLRLEVPLLYPTPIATTVEAVRGNVRDRVETLTGYRVRGLDVIVSALTDPKAGPVRTSRTE